MRSMQLSLCVYIVYISSTNLSLPVPPQPRQVTKRNARRTCIACIAYCMDLLEPTVGICWNLCIVKQEQASAPARLANLTLKSFPVVQSSRLCEMLKDLKDFRPDFRSFAPRHGTAAESSTGRASGPASKACGPKRKLKNRNKKKTKIQWKGMERMKEFRMPKDSERSVI